MSTSVSRKSLFEVTGGLKHSLKFIPKLPTISVTPQSNISKKLDVSHIKKISESHEKAESRNRKSEMAIDMFKIKQDISIQEKKHNWAPSTELTKKVILFLDKYYSELVGFKEILSVLIMIIYKDELYTKTAKMLSSDENVEANGKGKKIRKGLFLESGVREINANSLQNNVTDKNLDAHPRRRHNGSRRWVRHHQGSTSSESLG